MKISRPGENRPRSQVLQEPSIRKRRYLLPGVHGFCQNVPGTAGAAAGAAAAATAAILATTCVVVKTMAAAEAAASFYQAFQVDPKAGS